MKLFNTLSGRIEEFTPRRPGHVDFYVCGPTVYGPPHLGHARTAISFDVIRKAFTHLGFEVRFVSNFTDVNEKIVAKAHAEGRTEPEIARRYEAEWTERMSRMRVDPPDETPRASEYIGEMRSLIERLVAGGHAYAADGDVYFRVRSFPEYGKLSHQDIGELQAGARVEPGEHKEDPLDFALWKAGKPGEPTWESPWGPGRPGWHIECSAMSEATLGLGFDVHGGGNDLIFPHHENEVAQSEAADAGHVFARYWMHSGMVNLQGEKMAKSTGNFVSLDDLLTAHRPEALRLLVLQTHYRSPLDFAPELVAENEAALDRLAALRDRAAEVGGVDAAAPFVDPAVRAAEPDAAAMAAFDAALADDVATPAAVAALFDLVKRANVAFDAGAGAEVAVGVLAAMARIDAVLGVVPRPEVGADADLLDGLVRLALDLRAAARARKDFAAADAVRDRLEELGIVVEDTSSGARWRRGRRSPSGS